MAASEEVAVTSCLNDTMVSAYMWDVQTGTSLKTYRGDCPVTTSGLSLLSEQYVVAALQHKPFLCMWPVHSQQALSSPRMVCPGRVTHAQASPSGCYIAVTVGEKLHLYQVASGRLVGTGARHFQPIRVLRWTRDGFTVVCGGEDGLVTVWSLAGLTSPSPQSQHTLSDHILPVTDLTTSAGTRPRLLSVSVDRTCKIYDLKEGMLLVSLVFDRVLTSVALAPLETDVFLGTDSGSILQLSLLSPPRHLEYHPTAEESAPIFSGHTGAVLSLSTSLSGELLMSGASDGNVKLWHVSSRQCLRTLPHKGPITNTFFAPRPKQLFENELQPSVVLNAFQTAHSEGSDCVEVITKENLSLSDYKVRDIFPSQAANYSEGRIQSLETEIDLLRSINVNLYKFSVDKIIAGNSVLPCPTEVLQQPGKQRKRKKKRLDKVSDAKRNNVNVVKVNSVVLSVNGLSNNKKKKKKNRKKQIKKIET